MIVLSLLETTDFTTTPEIMLEAFTRIVSDRMIGEIFFKNTTLDGLRTARRQCTQSDRS